MLGGNILAIIGLDCADKASLIVFSFISFPLFQPNDLSDADIIHAEAMQVACAVIIAQL